MNVFDDNDLTQKYLDSVKALELLPRIALLFSEYDETEIERLAKNFTSLQEDSRPTYGLFHSLRSTGLCTTTKVANGIRLATIGILIRSHIEAEIMNKKNLAQTYDAVLLAYQDLELANVDTDNEVNSLAIRGTIAQLKNTRNNDTVGVSALKNTLQQVDTLNVQIKEYINIAKMEATGMKDEDLRSQIMNDNENGVKQTIDAFLNMLNTTALGSTQNVSYNWDTSHYNEHPAHKELAEVYTLTKSIFEKSPQKAIPILPILNLVYASGQERLNAYADPSLTESAQNEIASESIQLMELLCKQITAYFDNISSIQKRKSQVTLRAIRKAMDETKTPDLSKFVDDEDEPEETPPTPREKDEFQSFMDSNFTPDDNDPS